jgi:hypothetical protein
VLYLITHVRRGDALRKPRNTGQEGRQPNTRLRIGNGLAISRAKHERIPPLAPDKRLTPITGRPEIHIVARSAEHDVAVRGAAGCRSAVRSTKDDVPTGTAVNHIVAVQSKDHVIARPAFEDVGAIEGLVRGCTSLNSRVVNIVVVPPNEELRPLATLSDCRLDGMGRAQSHAQQGDQQASRQNRQTKTGD